MSDNPYVNFYTSDFLAGTSGLTAATKGVYITLLCLMYEAEAPVSQPWETLARRCGCTLPAFKKAIDVLVADGKVAVSDMGIWSEKCAKHIALRRERQSSARSAAKIRWEKMQQKQGKANATASNPQCQPEPEPYIKGDTNVSPKKRGTRLPDDWTLPKAWGEWALDQGWSEPVIRVEADKFRDYWFSVSGQKGVKADWQATWRNWMRNSKSPKVISDGQPTSKSEAWMQAFIAGARGSS